MTDHEKQHRRAQKLYKKLSNRVDRGFGDEPCKPRTLRSLQNLRKEVFHGKDSQMFMYRPWCAHARYNEVLIKAAQLRAVTGSRPTTQKETGEREAALVPVAAFFSTFSAAAIVFTVSVHFGSVVPPTIQRMMGV